jgi:hypothetical protein
LLCCAAQAQTPAPTADAHPAGVVTLAEGGARLTPAGAAPREIKVGDVVSEGDLLITSKDGELHMVMQDTGFMALRPNSRMVVVSYKADGGDDDKGVFKLLAGGLRSITGWIGRFNARAYQVRTPTATIGIRGTDHETHVILEGSAEAEAGTYDKVYAGQTYIETAQGSTAVDPDRAGFVSAKPRQRPRLLSHVPAFFRPGPHEVDIARKHAEIQALIDQRRSERRKVIMEKLTAVTKARERLKADFGQARGERQQGGKLVQALHAETGEQHEALQQEAEQLKQRFSVLKAQRAELQALAKSGQATRPELRSRRKTLIDAFIALQSAHAGWEARHHALQASMEERASTKAMGNPESHSALRADLQDVREKRKELAAELVSAREEIGALQRQENQRLRGERRADR